MVCLLGCRDLACRKSLKYLYIVRHGETEWNVLGRLQGRLDSPLTDLGQDHARANGHLIKSLGGVDQLYVSPSGRTTETAYLMNSFTKVDIEFNEALMERDCGEWSGLNPEEIEQNFPLGWAQRATDPYWYQPPGGENLHDMGVRVQSFLEDLYAVEAQRVALITHGVMSKVILKYYLDLGELEVTRIKHPNNLVYRLTFYAQDIDTHRFVAGGEAQPGLLRREAEVDQHPVEK